MTLGYDVGPRLTMALGGPTFRDETRRSTHAFAGTFGSAAAAGCAAALTAQQMRWLLDYASQQASGYAVWGRDTDHIEKAFVFGGMPARNGVTAALLVRAGWNGVDDVFSGDDNFFRVNAPKGNPAVLVEQLGERFEIINTDIKKWTVGTPIQAPLDAIENLRRKRAFDADDVKEVVVRLAPSVGAVVDNRDIPDICLQHMVAVMLDRQDRVVPCRARQGADAGCGGPAPAGQGRDTCRMPSSRGCCRYALRSSRSHLPTGRGFPIAWRPCGGLPRNPMPRSEVVDKARDLIAPVTGSRNTQKLIDAVMSLEKVKEIRTLRPLLQRA